MFLKALQITIRLAGEERNKINKDNERDRKRQSDRDMEDRMRERDRDREWVKVVIGQSYPISLVLQVQIL